MALDPPRISTPRGQQTQRERAIPSHLPTFEIPDAFVAVLRWQSVMDAYRVGKLDL
jgi:hypothetical protein